MEKTTGRETVWITFINKGEAAGEIVGLGGYLGLWENSEWKDANPAWKIKPISPIAVAAGEPHRYDLDLTDDLQFAQGSGIFEAKVQPSESKAAIIGAIQYRAKDGSVRETGFHRAYDPVRKCWQPIKYSQYEYAD